MTKACVLVFFQYFPRVDKQYKTQGKVFMNQVKKWADQIDHFYIANGGWEFDWLPKNTTVHAEDMRSHTHYLNTMTNMVKEDAILYLDPDILVYDLEVIKRGFEALETHDVAGILDNSAQVPLENEFDLFKANENRGVRRRFTPYMTFIKSNLIKGLDFDWVDGKYDSMGLITHEVMKKGVKYCEFEDDRNTLRVDEQGNFSKDTWLDGAPYKWSTPHDKQKDLGYYHVRNSSVGLSMLKEFKTDREAYDRRKSTMPFTEVMRLLAWQWLYDKAAQEDWSEGYWPVLNDFNVSRERWNEYIKQLEEYYPWLGKL
jgi:hypothetical protein